MSSTTHPPLGVTRARILEALARFHFLTIAQVLDLFDYKPGSLRWVKQLLRDLRVEGYIERTLLPAEKPPGGGLAVHYLSRSGFKLVKELEQIAGLELPERYRRPERPPAIAHLVRHDLVVTDFLIQMQRLNTHVPEITVEKLLHDRDMKRAPIEVTLPDGKSATMVPDCVVSLRHHPAGENWQYVLNPEADRNTHAVSAWKKKVRRYIAYIKGGYHEQLWGTTSLTIPVYATRGVNRAAELKQWTEDVLRELGAEAEYDRFCFADLEPRAVEPQAIVYEPMWYQPFTDTPISLIVQESAPLSSGFEVMPAL